MTTILKPVALSACVLAMLCSVHLPQAPFKVGLVREAAGLIVAPVRRTAISCSSWRNPELARTGCTA